VSRTTAGRERWPVGEPEVQNLIDEGELQQVEPSEEHAEFLLDQADTHLASAAKLVDDDPSGALAMLYDAARKAMTAPSRGRGYGRRTRTAIVRSKKASRPSSGPMHAGS
jgi:hypothetical protein